MKYYIIAGEASGDMHGANLIKAIHNLDNKASIRSWGGDMMATAGSVLVKHIKDLAFMGFWEVLKNLKTIINNLNFCKKDILKFEPDALILIDYPGFNLRIAKWAKKNKIKIYYYISPQIWAWHSSRVHKIISSTEKMFVILPFEKEFYAKYGYEVDYVGHPLVERIAEHQSPINFYTKNKLDKRPIIALLPGSRRQEIKQILKTMLAIVPSFADSQFIIAAAPALPAEFYHKIIEGIPNIKLVQKQTYDLLSVATAALVTSGTATLEAALFNVPQVVCYKGNPLSYFIARRLINVKYICLVNLILDRPLLQELIQFNFNPKTLRSALEDILDNGNKDTIITAYQELKNRLGNGHTSALTAQLIVEELHLKP